MTTRMILPVVSLGLALLAIFSSAVTAQTPGPQIRQGASPPPRDQRSTAVAGTTVIRGQVLAADTGRPLRRARIRLSAPELGNEPRTTSTNLDGRYEIKDLPAGRYTIQVSRSGYLSLNYGQRRPLEQGKPLQVSDKQVIENIDFALPRTSVITGRITDEFGEVVSDAQIFAMRSTYFLGRRRIAPAGPVARTDDAGQYRIAGLPPGTYVVMATLRETWTVNEKGVEQTIGYAPTYFPSATTVANAQRVTVGIAQEVGGTDFSLIPGRAVTITGTATDSRGRPLAGRRVGVSQEIVGPAGGSYMSAGGATIGPDGTFTIRNVAPGEYRLGTSTTIDSATSTTPIHEAARIPLVITDGADVTGVTLTTSAGWSVSGRIVTEDGSIPSLARDRIRILGRLVDGDMNPRTGDFIAADSGRVKEDWTFLTTNIFGLARIRATLPDGWAVKSILHEGHDIADTPMELRSGEELSSIQVVVTNRVTTLTGQLNDEKGTPLTYGTVVVFANDRQKWVEESRWVRAARPDQQGEYQIKGLPPGEYLAVALEYVEDGIWHDAEYLDSIREHAQKLTLREGQSESILLKLVTPQ